MSMTRGEAIEELERLLSHWDDLENEKRSFRWYSKTAIEVALSALRPVSREQVEKVWRGEWTEETYTTQSERGRVIHSIKNTCSACGKTNGRTKTNFCPSCGAPMTDEAVQMVMERLEEMRNG